MSITWETVEDAVKKYVSASPDIKRVVLVVPNETDLSKNDLPTQLFGLDIIYVKAREYADSLKERVALEETNAKRADVKATLEKIIRTNNTYGRNLKQLADRMKKTQKEQPMVPQNRQQRRAAAKGKKR